MALIRCKHCGNLASSRTPICPICGEPISGEQPSAPTAESVAPVAENRAENTPEVEAPAEDTLPVEAHEEATNPMDTPAAQPKTLNDILAERSTTSTLNDTHSEENSESRTLNVVPMPTPINNALNNDAYAYDNERTVEDYEMEIRRRKRSAGGFMIGCIILLLGLATFCYLYISMRQENKKLREGYEILIADTNSLHAIEREMLNANAEELVGELAKYKDDNDSMRIRYEEAVKMYTELQSNHDYTLDQLRRYQEEVKTLKGIMRQYVRQIDSLNTVASNLKRENTSMKKEIKSHELRANQAEERADELGTKVRQAEVIQTSAIRLVALNANSKEVKRIKMARRLKVDFELVPNAVAEPGEKSIYVCITNPDGYLLSPAEMTVFNFEGTEMMASAVRKVDYENARVDVSIFYDGENFTRGTYKVDIYIDGRHCGTAEKYFE